MRDATDLQGRFTSDFPLVEGAFVKDADKAIIAELKREGRLFKHETINHDYPFCWRSGTPLIYKAISTWFVNVSVLREKMVQHNETTNWVPNYVGDKRFHNWLKDARDWAISRNRFWSLRSFHRTKSVTAYPRIAVSYTHLMLPTICSV